MCLCGVVRAVLRSAVRSPERTISHSVAEPREPGQSQERWIEQRELKAGTRKVRPTEAHRDHGRGVAKCAVDAL